MREKEARVEEILLPHNKLRLVAALSSSLSESQCGCSRPAALLSCLLLSPCIAQPPVLPAQRHLGSSSVAQLVTMKGLSCR